MSSIKVSNIKITPLTPMCKNKEIVALFPTIIKKQFEFTLTNANIAVANGLRRVLMSEILVSSMDFDIGGFATSDPFLMNDMMQSRIRHVPLVQNVGAKDKYVIDVKNTSEEPIIITTAHIKGVSKPAPFNTNIEMCRLNPACSLKISIFISRRYGYNFGSNVLTSGAVCIPLDQKPINLYDPKPDEVLSTMCDPHSFLIRAITNGTMEVNKIVSLACSTIIDRCTEVIKTVDFINSNGNVHIFNIPVETDTMGRLISKTMVEMFSEVENIGYFYKDYSDLVEVKILYDGDIKPLMVKVLERIITNYKEISAFFKN